MGIRALSIPELVFQSENIRFIKDLNLGFQIESWKGANNSRSDHLILHNTVLNDKTPSM